MYIRKRGKVQEIAMEYKQKVPNEMNCILEYSNMEGTRLGSTTIEGIDRKYWETLQE